MPKQLNPASKCKHYLITLEVYLDVLRMHAYLMCDDKRCVDNTVERMMDEAEKIIGSNFILPVVLVTQLSSGVDLVRGIITKHEPQVAETIRKARDFHLTVWISSTVNNPDDARLMELH